MLVKLARIFCFIILLSLANDAQIARSEYSYVVRGRAIDERGQPVPHANVTVTLSPGNRGDFTYSYDADADGGIYFQYEHSNAPKRTRLLYVTDPLPPNAISMLSPPFKNFRNLTDRIYAGRQILIKKNGQVDLGDIQVRVHYGLVKVYLRDRSGNPLVTDGDGWEYVWLRIRNVHGYVVAERNLTRNEIKEAVNLHDSSTVVALPQGRWLVDASMDEDKGPWLTSKSILTVRAGNNPLEVTLRFVDKGRE